MCSAAEDFQLWFRPEFSLDKGQRVRVCMFVGINSLKTCWYDAVIRPLGRIQALTSLLILKDASK